LINKIKYPIIVTLLNKLDGSKEPLLVLVVSVLDVLCQPVLGPVDFFTSNWNLLLFKDDPELVMLHLVVNTVEVGNFTELSFFIDKVLLQKSLQVFKNGSIIRVLGNSKDLLEENIMLSINLRIVSGKGLIPDIWFRNRVSKFSSVAKVSVHDVLSKPVLGPFDFSIVNWSIHLGKSFTEENVLPLVVLAVIPVNVLGITELALLIDEVVSHCSLKFFNFALAQWILFNCS